MPKPYEPSALEVALRETVREMVRAEVRAVLAEIAPRPDDYLSTRAAAKLAGVADGTIRRWIRERRLESHRAGRHVRVRRADLERMMRDDGRRGRELSPEERAEEFVRKRFGLGRAGSSRRGGVASVGSSR
jgi:excisionase family DNA binding protein